MLLYSVLFSTLVYSTLLRSTLLYSTLLCSTPLHYTLLCSALLCFTLFHHALLCSALLCSALLYSTLLYSTLLYSTLLYSTLLYSIVLTNNSQSFILLGTRSFRRQYSRRMQTSNHKKGRLSLVLSSPAFCYENKINNTPQAIVRYAVNGPRFRVFHSDLRRTCHKKIMNGPLYKFRTSIFLTFVNVRYTLSMFSLTFLMK